MWGAAGGSETTNTLGGGGGGFTEGEIDISSTSQNTLYMIVGEGGGSDGSTGVPGKNIQCHWCSKPRCRWRRF